MKLQQLLSYTRRAVDDYHMIQEGDKIAVGISGGKDSLAMLYALHGLRFKRNSNPVRENGNTLHDCPHRYL